MRLTISGEQLSYRGNIYTVGGGVFVTALDYQGLYGVIREICDGDDQVIPDGPPEIFCSFHPPISDDLAERIMRRYEVINGKHLDIGQICAQEVIMKPSQLRPMKQCRIYQVDGKDCRYLFQPFEKLQEYGMSAPDRNAYRTVYDGQLQTDNLEEIFYIFNCRHPKGFTGRSLTTSDIVELYDESGSEYHYCDRIGWVKFSGFI